MGYTARTSPPCALFSWRDGGQVQGPRYWRLATWQTAPGDWRAGLALARSFPREGARGKVLGGQSQNLVVYGLELREYFANLIANLAIWQTALWCLARRCIVAPRCVQCGATTCNAVQGGYVQCVQRATTALRIGGRGCPGGYPTTLTGGRGWPVGWQHGLLACLDPVRQWDGSDGKMCIFLGIETPHANSFGGRRGVVRWENTRRSRSFGSPPIASLGARRP
jgi:hypothetical protein